MSAHSSNRRSPCRPWCIAHIQRSSSKVLETKRGAARRFGTQLKAQLQAAVELYHSCHQAEGKLPAYEQRVRQLDLESTWQLRPRVLQEADNQRLLNELGRHHDNQSLLRFLASPTTVEPTNNAAERALRPAVMARKVSQCSKNKRGAAAYAAFKSVIGTLKKSGGEVLENLARLLVADPSQEVSPANTS